MVSAKVGVVTVTYGDRGNYISKVLSKCLELEEVAQIIVVSNNSSEKSLKKIELLKGNSKLSVLSLDYNSGSAKAFSLGIKNSLKKDIDYIWLLDDDNLPNSKAIKTLLNGWSKFNTDDNKLFSLLSYRPDRDIYKQAIQTSNPYLMLGVEDSFLGFDIFSKFLKKKTTFNANIKSGEVAVAPYGGMFFKKELIDVIGLPDEKFYLYADDHEFSYRITKNSGKIILLLDSEIQDLEKSFHLKSKKFYKTRFSNTNSKSAIYYSVRNNVFFEKNFVKNKLKYKINKSLYLVLLFFLMTLNFSDIKKFPIIIKAIKDSKYL